jgi:hypothetical protein
MIGAWVERLFNKHKLMRRATMFWCMGLITYITVNNPDMDTGNFTAVIGLMTIVVGLYQWDKARDSDK